MPYGYVPAAPQSGIPWVDALVKAMQLSPPTMGMVGLNNPLVRQTLGLTAAMAKDSPLLTEQGQAPTPAMLNTLLTKYPLSFLQRFVGSSKDAMATTVGEQGTLAGGTQVPLIWAKSGAPPGFPTAPYDNYEALLKSAVTAPSQEETSKFLEALSRLLPRMQP